MAGGNPKRFWQFLRPGPSLPPTSVWTSPDGVVWTLAATLEPGSHMAASAAGGSLGFGNRWDVDAAEGMLRPRPAVWRSSDAVSWSLVEDPVLEGTAGQMFGLAEGPTGLVGVGFDCPDPEDVNCWESLGFWDSRPAIWTSPDGLVWDRVVDDPAVFLEGRLLDVAATPWGWVAVGKGTPSTGGDDDAVAYLSSDGVEWSRIDLPDRSDGGLCERADAIAVSADRVSISGKCWKLRSDSGSTRVPGVWMSDDGIEWTLIESFDGDAPRSGGSGRLTATDSGFLMVGAWEEDMRAGPSHFSVWVSPDETTWEQTTFEDREWWTGGVCSHENVALAVGGYLHDDDTERARVWIGTATPK